MNKKNHKMYHPDTLFCLIKHLYEYLTKSVPYMTNLK